MSTTSVQDFFTKVGEDQALQAEMAKALEADNDREAVTELANSKGYDFSSEELWAEIQARQAELAKRQKAGEISDEELEAVAGGATPALATYMIVKSVIVGGTISAAVTIDKNAKW
ncbi:MAG: Nif11-like leader peptide family natural product precursor [Leptolyngbya sp. SIO1E4]|nr:Nif11-like leader peptide family natural product precursor [Leptolyngbya sp. SIO1E4]